MDTELPDFDFEAYVGDVEEGIRLNAAISADLERAIYNYANHFGDQSLLLFIQEWAKRNGLPWREDNNL
jgi:hypothetical protein